MKLILRQLGFLLLSIATVYGVLLGISLLMAPLPSHRDGLDTGRAAKSLYLTEPKYVFLGRGALDTSHDKIILLGASNVVVGFRQQQVQALLPGAEVSNLAVGGSNVTQLRQIVDLVHAAQSPQARRHNIFVVGIWYGLFADDDARWNTPDRHAGDTDIDIERYRYGFYRRGARGPEPVLPASWLPLGLTLIHPSLVADRLLRDATDGLRARLKGKAAPLDDARRNAVVLSEEDKARYLAFWSNYMGERGVSPRQFETLRAMVADIRGQGGRVLLVDLPLPQWHAGRSPYTHAYVAQLSSLADSYAAQDKVTVLGMGGGAADQDFSDEVHPKPRVTSTWARQLAGALAPAENDSVLSLNGSGASSEILPPRP